MFDFKKIHDDNNGIDIILDSCNEQLNYYRMCMDTEISTDNNSDKIKYYKYAIANLENTIRGIIKNNPGHEAIAYLLRGLGLIEPKFIEPSPFYMCSVLFKAIKCNRLNRLYMIYLRDTIYVKSLHNVVKESIDKLSISVDMTKTSDDAFEYSINNIISELKKMDLLDPIDVDIVKYISEIYLMIFDLMKYHSKFIKDDKEEKCIFLCDR
jgi:hypothetical protein|nr:MAG TPA: hypothetical protein [Caudoviricetes sp.]